MSSNYSLGAYFNFFRFSLFFLMLPFHRPENIFYTLIRTRTLMYQEVRNIRFSVCKGSKRTLGRKRVKLVFSKIIRWKMAAFIKLCYDRDENDKVKLDLNLLTSSLFVSFTSLLIYNFPKGINPFGNH